MGGVDRSGCSEGCPSWMPLGYDSSGRQEKDLSLAASPEISGGTKHRNASHKYDMEGYRRYVLCTKSEWVQLGKG